MVNGLDQGDRHALFERAVLETGYWPGRGIVYSLLFHTMLFSTALYLSISGTLSEPQFRLQARPLEDRLDLTEVVYLPVLSGGDAGQAPGELAEGIASPAVAAANPPEGLAYPGPQEILSEFPDPTNGFQTILRPALEDPQTLSPSLGIPNLIQLEDRAVVQAEAPSREVLVAPVLEASNEVPEELPEPVEMPRIDLDPQVRADLSALAAELNSAQPLPVDPAPVGLPERSLEPVETADLSALASNPNPLQALPARQVDLALPMRSLVPTESVALTELAAEASVLQPLPVRAPDMVLPTRTLEPVPTQPADLAQLGAGSEAIQPLPVDSPDMVLPTRTLEPVPTRPADLAQLGAGGEAIQPLPVDSPDMVLPTRSLAREPAPGSELAALASGPRSFEPLPVERVGVGLPSRDLEARESAELAQLAGGQARRSSGGLPVDPMPVARPRPGFDLPRLDVTEGSDGVALEDILALSPMPAAERGPLPVGELRGTFAISPRPNLETSEDRPGARVDESASESGDEADSGSFSEFLASRAAGGTDDEGGGGTDPASGGGGEADATGRSADGAGGTGDGTGTNAFPGITILAGGDEPVASPADTGVSVIAGGPGPGLPTSRTDEPRADLEPERAPGHLQTSYGVTAVTTESSGGGLPDFGVFADEQVHIVFFDMRRRAADTTPPWTVEYGVPQGTRVESNSTGRADELAPNFVLPFPIDRAQPAFPANIAERFPGQIVIAYAVINADGRPEEISIKQSPDPRLIQPVYDALSRWRFRAARLDGTPVAVKMLVGIPLWR